MEQERQEFEKEAATARQGLAGEIWRFVLATRKWWLVPILLTLLAVSLLVYLSSSAAAPFIYTIF